MEKEVEILLEKFRNKTKEFLKKFRNSEKTENNPIGFMQGILYILTTLLFTVLFLPEVGVEGTKKVFELKSVIGSSILGTVSGFACTLIFALLSYFVSIFLSKRDAVMRFNKKINKNHEVVEYNFYNIVCDTYYWIVKACDLLLSILTPFLVALFFFENSDGKTKVEAMGSLITIALMPTLVLVNTRSYIKVIFIGIFEVLKGALYLSFDLFVTLIIFMMIITEKK